MKIKAAILVLLTFILDNQRTLMTAQDEAAAKLNAVADQLGKVQTEIQALKTAASAESVSPALQAAIDRVSAAAQADDDENADAPAAG